MTKTPGAIYVGKAFNPDEPVEIQPNTQFTITIEIPVEAISEKNGQEEPFEKLFGSVSLGHSIGLDNEQINEDLALEYASAYEDED